MRARDSFVVVSGLVGFEVLGLGLSSESRGARGLGRVFSWHAEDLSGSVWGQYTNPSQKTLFPILPNPPPPTTTHQVKHDLTSFQPPPPKHTPPHHHTTTPPHQVKHDLLEFHDLHVAELYGARNRSHHEVDLVITLGGACGAQSD